MASKHPPRKPASPPDRPTASNEGEGNKTADRNYREATREFVNSDRGKEEIRHAGDVDAQEQREIEQAEADAKARASEHDPAEVRSRSRPS
ncbi:hypothetical protein [Povalibacter sp.]|uniref:hypothetical protein n=1 Tax=Povalibacter sp. TaxID=1962978 RepID=UPI002F4270E3